MKCRAPLSLFISLIIALPVLLFAQEPGLSAPAPEESKSLWGLIQQGGWAMYPLALCSLATFFLILYSWRETARKKFIPDRNLNDISTSLYERDLSGALQNMEAAPCALSRALSSALAKARPEKEDANKEKIETAFIEAMEGEENGVSQWINYLNVVATVSPMIGLLGTVSGMIGAFSTIASGGMGRPELLAGDIGEALITTATGLVIGIPAMVAFFILRNRLHNMMLATSQAAGLLIDYLAGEIILFGEDKGEEGEEEKEWRRQRLSKE